MGKRGARALNGGAKLDEVVHQRNRLAILAVLQEASKAEFGFLQTNLELTPGNLSRHLEILEAAGYVEIEKGYSGKRPRTWVRITKAGRTALRAEVAALRTMLRQVDAPPGGGVTIRPLRREGQRPSHSGSPKAINSPPSEPT